MRLVVRFLTLAALASALLAPRAVQARPSSVSAAASKGVIRITMAILQVEFPRDALAMVTLTVTNTSKRPVTIQRNNPQCGAFQPEVDVLDSHGNPSSLPTEDHFARIPCPAPSFVKLAPGRSRTWHRHVVLTGPKIVASQKFGAQGTVLTVKTPPITVTLTPSAPRPVLLDANGPTAVVPGDPEGPLYFSQSAKCPSGSAASVITQFSWSKSPDTHIDPPCTAPSEWHLVVGYPNEPVGTLDYPLPGS